MASDWESEEPGLEPWQLQLPGNLWPQVAKKNNNKSFPAKNSVPLMIKKNSQGAL